MISDVNEGSKILLVIFVTAQDFAINMALPHLSFLC